MQQLYAELASIAYGDADRPLGVQSRSAVRSGRFRRRCDDDRLPQEARGGSAGAIRIGRAIPRCLEQNDGAFHAHPVVHTTPSASIEILETEFPIRARLCEALRDSGGAGRYRGGAGCVREYEILDDAIFTLRVGGFKSGSWGVEGGQPGALGRCIIDPGSAQERVLPSLFTTDLSAGAILRVEMAGGSGFGDPKDREPRRVLEDVQNGYVSVDAAQALYGVSICEESNGIYSASGGSDAKH